MIRAEYRPESDKFESVRSEDPDSIKKGILVPLDPGQSGWRSQEDHTIPSQHVPVLWQDISEYGSDCTQECPGFVLECPAQYHTDDACDMDRGVYGVLYSEISEYGWKTIRPCATTPPGTDGTDEWYSDATSVVVC